MLLAVCWCLYDLMQPHQYASAMQREAIQQIEAAKPAFLLLVNVDTSWVIFDGADRTIMNWAKAYSAANYETAGMIWILSDLTEYAWGADALTRSYTTPLRVSVMRRKPGI